MNDDIITSLANDLIARHWGFVAVAILLGAIGSIMKQLVTKKMAETSKAACWFRRTMPIHPVIAGAALGLSSLLPVTSLASPVYYALAGAVSAWAYSGAQHYLEQKKVLPVMKTTMDGIEKTLNELKLSSAADVDDVVTTDDDAA
jgi:hypothetical protein